jgi:hypothetical protein
MTAGQLMERPAISYAIAPSVTAIEPPSLISLNVAPSKQDVRDPLQRHVESAASSAVPKEEQQKQNVDKTNPSNNRNPHSHPTTMMMKTLHPPTNEYN